MSELESWWVGGGKTPKSFKADSDMQDLDVFPDTYMVWRVSREPTLIYAFYVHLVICHAPDSVTTRHYLFVWVFQNFLYSRSAGACLCPVSATAAIWEVRRLVGPMEVYLNSALASRIMVTSIVKDGGGTRGPTIGTCFHSK